MPSKTCQKCGKTLQDVNFYTRRNGVKMQKCKDCLTMFVDNFDPDSFIWILKELDIPYVPIKWNTIRDKEYAKKGLKMDGKSVLGKYISQMKLKQWKQYGWDDTEKLREQTEKNIQRDQQLKAAQNEIVRKQFEAGQITQAQYRTLVDTDYQKKHEYIMPTMTTEQFLDPVGKDNYFREQNFISQDELPDLATELTLQDKKYLVLKWGRTYKPNQLIELQKKWTEMTSSFDIQDADSKNSLLFICKTYLKMNQAIDCGDIEGYQKLSRVYDALRKSAKFTAVQNKEDKANFVDSIGQVVAFCEKEGGRIPRFKIKQPDEIDKIIEDLKEYNRSLIYEDTALARQIQDYLAQKRAVAAKKQDEAAAKKQGYDVPQLTPQDTLDFKDFLKRQREATSDEIKRGEGENN